MQPKVMLFDEVTSALDPEIVEEGPPDELLYHPKEERTQAFLKSFSQGNNQGN